MNSETPLCLDEKRRQRLIRLLDRKTRELKKGASVLAPAETSDEQTRWLKIYTRLMIGGIDESEAVRFAIWRYLHAINPNDVWVMWLRDNHVDHEPAGFYILPWFNDRICGNEARCEAAADYWEGRIPEAQGAREF